MHEVSHRFWQGGFARESHRGDSKTGEEIELIRVNDYGVFKFLAAMPPDVRKVYDLPAPRYESGLRPGRGRSHQRTSGGEAANQQGRGRPEATRCVAWSHGDYCDRILSPEFARICVESRHREVFDPFRRTRGPA